MKIVEMTKEQVFSALEISIASAKTNHYQEFNFDPETWEVKVLQLVNRLMELEKQED